MTHEKHTIAMGMIEGGRKRKELFVRGRVENSRRFHSLEILESLMRHGGEEFGLMTVARLSCMVSQE